MVEALFRERNLSRLGFFSPLQAHFLALYTGATIRVSDAAVAVSAGAALINEFTGFPRQRPRLRDERIDQPSSH
jgi:hypothetical protein